MITFKNYLALFEDGANVSVPWESTDIPPSKVTTEYILAHCSDWLNDLENGKLLYRGTKSASSPFKLVDTTNSKRSSRDTNNLYQVIMDASENMKDVPSRSNSIISVSNHNTALAYSEMSPTKAYLMLPFNSTKIACFKYTDILNAFFESKKLEFSQLIANDSLTNFFKDVIGTNTLTSKTDVKGLFNKADLAKIVFFWDLYFCNHSGLIFEGLGEDIQGEYESGVLGDKVAFYSRTDYAGFESGGVLGKVFDFMRENNFATASQQMDEFVKLMEAGNNDYFKALASEIAKPEEMGISVQKVGSLTIGKFSECWFSGKCLMVRFDYVFPLIEELENKLGKKFTGFDYMRPYFKFLTK